jgi:phosphoglycolate phosphatase
MRYKAVLFDYDYTLVDSESAMDICYNTAISDYGYNKVETSRLKRLSGRTAKEILLELTGLNADTPLLSDILASFQKYSDMYMTDSTTVYDSVCKMAKLLTENDVRLGIVSNKSSARIEAVLKREGLRDYFAVIVGAPEKAKPDPYGIIQATRLLELNVSECVYVGDSITDAMTAKNADVDFIPVLTGATDLDEFQVYDYVEILNDLSLLPDIVSGRDEFVYDDANRASKQK